MPVKKYFIAIIMRGEIFERIEALKADLFKLHGFRGALRSPAHITLHRPFEWKEEKEQQLIKVLQSFKFHSFNTELRGFGAFSQRVIYVGVEPNPDLNFLHDSFKKFAQKELKLYNEANDLRGFHPHITIASRDLKKRHFEEIWPLFADKQFGASFYCNEVSLLKFDKNWTELQSFAL